VLAAGAFMFYRLFRGELRRAVIYAIGGALLTGFLLFNATTLALLAIALATLRFAYRAMIWLLYERLYITNRRVILAQGFLGSDISTMPLTRLTDLNYTTTVAGELLGYASQIASGMVSYSMRYFPPYFITPVWPKLPLDRANAISKR